jgi:hypothetical protein
LSTYNLSVKLYLRCSKSKNKMKPDLPHTYAKRRTASMEECHADLANEMPMMFAAFRNAFTLYEQEIVQTPVHSRARAFEASLLNSKMIQSIQEYFPAKWRFGRYKRFILRVNGYTVLFKKLNRNGKPMNISTNYTSAISNQLVLSLFNDRKASVDPILFFGYQKDSTGAVINPKLVYIDDNQVKWIITEKDIHKLPRPLVVIPADKKPAMPKLKSSVVPKKAANE